MGTIYDLLLDDKQHDSWWHCRGLVEGEGKNKRVSFLWHDSSEKTETKQKMIDWLNNVACPKFHADFKKGHTILRNPSSYDVWELKEDKNGYTYCMRGCPNGSYGYIYIGGWIDKN
jgi:hypothetical protein